MTGLKSGLVLDLEIKVSFFKEVSSQNNDHRLLNDISGWHF